MDKLELLKIIKYVLTAVSERDHYKLLALQDHLDTLHVESEHEGNLYIAKEIVHHALKEV